MLKLFAKQSSKSVFSIQYLNSIVESVIKGISLLFEDYSVREHEKQMMRELTPFKVKNWYIHD
jgi:hypothetical protein